MENDNQMNYWIEEIEKTKHVHIKMLRYRHDVDHGVEDRMFSAEDLVKFKSYKSKKRRLEFYFTRVLWKSFEIQEEILYKKTGKPILKQGFVSISHSHDCIAITYSRTIEMGVDIEPISEKIRKVKHKFSHPEENFDSLVDLTKSWCIKEAVYKLLDMYDVIFMDDILVKETTSPAKTLVRLAGSVEIKTQVKVIELPNDMIMAYAFK